MKNTISKTGNIHLIGVQSKYRKQVGDFAIKGLVQASKILKYKKAVDIAVFDSEFWDIPAGLQISAHGRVYYIDIKICFHRKDINVKNLISIELPLTILHEFCHVVRANTIGYPETFIDAIIDEGIACYTEQSLNKDRIIPYIKASKDEKKFLVNAKKLFSTKLTSELHNEWFFGSQKIPNWMGYRLGYIIVSEMMKNNKIRIDKLCRMKSRDILERSGI